MNLRLVWCNVFSHVESMKNIVAQKLMPILFHFAHVVQSFILLAKDNDHYRTCSHVCLSVVQN